jgi:AraC family transcriptional regulator of adaptative response/methylated-DNA-[protein]-cysteine methyltransferase
MRAMTSSTQSEWSPGAWQETFERTFGSFPARGGLPAGLVVSWLESPLGPLVVGATSDGVCLLEFTEPDRLDMQLATIRRLFDTTIAPGDNLHLDRLREEMAAYFAGHLTCFTVPLVYPGTPFQRRVWDELQRIPYGVTRSYEDLALTIGTREAVRAVGRANGQNRIAIVIPCHRVVNKSGKLGGYGGGLWRKQWLLDLEQGSNGVRVLF